MQNRKRIYFSINANSSILLLLLFFSIEYSFCQSPNWVWAKRSGGTKSDYGNSITTDLSGNVIATGSFSSDSILFDNIVLYNSNPGGIIGTSDFFIVKYDPSGNVIWAKSAIGNASSEGTSVITDSSNNIIVAGNFQCDSIKFDITTLYKSGAFNFFTVKYDQAGNVIWANTPAGNKNSSVTKICINAFNGILLTGAFSSDSIVFGSKTLYNTPGSSGNTDIYFVKYDSLGSTLWAKSFGGDSSESGNGITTDFAGNIIATGIFFSDSIQFGSTILHSLGKRDVFTVKLDPSGSIIWAKSYGGNENDIGESITCDTQGNIILTGSFSSSNIYFGTIPLTNTSIPGDADFFLVKIDSSGHELWAKSAYGQPTELGVSVICDNYDNIILIGGFDGYSITIGSYTMYNMGSGNFNPAVFIAKYDLSGNVVWATGVSVSVALGGVESRSITIDKFGNYFVTGGFANASTSFGSITLQNAGGEDIFVGKIFETPNNIIENNKNSILIYPNPAGDKIFFTSISNIEKIYLMDETGRLIKSISYPCNNCSIDVSDLPEGFYFVNFSSEGFISRKKISVMH